MPDVSIAVEMLVTHVFIIEPDDEFVPKTHIREELDALKIPPDRRDSCKDYYAEFKKCIHVQH